MQLLRKKRARVRRSGDKYKPKIRNVTENENTAIREERDELESSI